MVRNVVLALGFISLLGTQLPADDDPAGQRNFITIRNPRALTAGKIPCERIPVGQPGDYKACIAVLPSGELLLTMFHQQKKENKKLLEQNLLFRSTDGGQTWSGPEELDLLGREPYLSVLKDGTIFITGHLLTQDVRNPHGYIHGYLHRSTDAGKTWQTTRIDSTKLGKPNANNHTSRNVLELADGTLLLGVDASGGPYYVWRSTDRGETWKQAPCEPIGFQSRWGFFGGETWLWQANSGKILALVRVDSKEFPFPGRTAVSGKWDHHDHEMLWESTDNGSTFRPAKHLGDYGQMYPALLRLPRGRLLYTFTVRDLHPPLGVQALLGKETDDGFRFDFDADRLIIDANTPRQQTDSGGGFGPTVQLRDGTLVTSYTYRDKAGETHAEVVRWRLPNATADPLLLAHRGLARHAPENTLPAFAAAIELGLSIELDVYQTRDEQLVVIHDHTVDRTTNGSGEVNKMTLAEIRKLDAGSWFNPSFAAEQVPTLEEVFKLIRERQREPVTIALNMKVISPGIEQRIVALVEKVKLFDQLFAFGQPSDSSRRFKEANAKLRTTVVKIYDAEQFAKALRDPLADCLWVGFVPTTEAMKQAHKLGKQVWLSLRIGENRPDIWDKARASKLDGICTDWPLECRRHWRRTARSPSNGG